MEFVGEIHLSRCRLGTRRRIARREDVPTLYAFGAETRIAFTSALQRLSASKYVLPQIVTR